jgi:hypothetical protein
MGARRTGSGGKPPVVRPTVRQPILSVTTLRYIRRARTEHFSDALHAQTG